MKTPFGTPTELATGLRLLTDAGVIAPVAPHRAALFPTALYRYGFTPTTAFVVGRWRHPDRVAIVDDRGTVTFREIHERTDRLARALADRRVGPGSRVAVLCRNHRGPIETILAVSKLGADVVLLNTGLSPSQMKAVAEEQEIGTIVVDSDLTDRLDEVPRQREARLRLDRGRRVLGRRHPRGPHRRRRLQAAGHEAAGRQDDRADLGHHGHAEGRRASLRRTASASSTRSSPASRSRPASTPWSRRRCSTRGGSRRSRSAR